jgi:two-component system LytT family response regulator
MGRLRVAVVEDEPPARRRLERLLAREPDVELLPSSGSAREALRRLDAAAVDCLFLDIELPGPSGLDLARRVRERGIRVVFVSAHAQHGPHAFDLDAVDYLLKPFDDARLARALHRVREAVCEVPADAASRSAWVDRLPVETAGRVRFVELDAIDWIEADDKRVLLHTGGEVVPLRQALHALEARLDPARFARIHRRVIVRVAAIVELGRAFHGDWLLTLRGGQQLLMSRRYTHRLRGLLGEAC